MLGGIVFQLVCIVVYSTLAAEFLWRYTKDMPFRRAPVSQHRSKTPRRLKIMLLGMSIMTVLLFIRSIYRTAELADGWSGTIIRTEWPFGMLLSVRCFEHVLSCVCRPLRRCHDCPRNVHAERDPPRHVPRARGAFVRADILDGAQIIPLVRGYAGTFCIGDGLLSHLYLTYSERDTLFSRMLIRKFGCRPMDFFLLYITLTLNIAIGLSTLYLAPQWNDRPLVFVFHRLSVYRYKNTDDHLNQVCASVT